MTPKVTVGIIVRDKYAPLFDCLQALMKSDLTKFDAVVIDDGAGCESKQRIHEMFPNVTLLCNAEPLGSAESVNQAIRFSIREKSDYLFVLNGSCCVLPETIKDFLGIIEQQGGHGIVLPRYEQPFGGAMTSLNWSAFIRMTGLSRRIPNVPECLLAGENPFISCLMAVKDIKSLGFVDPFYFDYYADTDWINKFRVSGGPVLMNSSVGLKEAVPGGAQYPSYPACYYRIRNLLYYVSSLSIGAAIVLGFQVVFFFILPLLIKGTIKRNERAAAFWSLAAIIDFIYRKRGQRSTGPGLGIILRLIGRLKGVFTSRKDTAAGPIRLLADVRWNLGDEVMVLPAFEILKNKMPDAQIVARMNYPELLQGNPYTSEYDKNSMAAGRETVLNLKSERRGMSRIRHLADRLGVDKLPLPKLYLTREEVASVRRKWDFKEGIVQIGLSTSAKWFSRRWDRDKWLQLAGYFEKRKDTRVLVLGKGDEHLPVGLNIMGQTNVREAAAILSQCDLFVGCDSGLVHLALAVGAPVVGLYGPLNPDYLIERRDSFVSIWSDIECRGCWSDGRMKYPDHCPKVVPDCMSKISVEQVIRACDSLLSRTEKACR